LVEGEALRKGKALRSRDDGFTLNARSPSWALGPWPISQLTIHLDIDRHILTG